MTKNSIVSMEQELQQCRAELLSKMLEMVKVVEDCRFPTNQAVNTLVELNTTARRKMNFYTRTVTEALNPDELPPKKSGFDKYAAAYRESSSRALKTMLEQGRNTLARFLCVCAKTSEYGSCLEPYQKKAKEVLESLDEENIESLHEEIVGPEAIIKVIETGNKDITQLKSIYTLYPNEIAIALGLAGGQYFIDLSEMTADESLENAAPMAGPVSDELPVSSHETEESPAIIEQIHTVAAVRVEDNAEISSDDDSPAMQTLMPDIAHETDGAYDADNLIKRKNKVKHGNPNARSLQSEFDKFGRSDQMCIEIMSLLTIIGVCTEMQASDFCAVLYRHVHSGRYRKRVSTAIDKLVLEGYLASYALSVDGKTETVYCLSNYIIRCFKFKSHRRYCIKNWKVIFGNHMLAGSDKMDRTVLSDIIRANKILLKYLEAEIKQVRDIDFYNICKSVKWAETAYRVNTVYDGSIYECGIYDSIPEDDNMSVENVIVVNDTVTSGSDTYPFNSLFLVREGTITRFAGNSEVQADASDSDGCSEPQDNYEALKEAAPISKDIIKEEIIKDDPEEKSGHTTEKSMTAANTDYRAALNSVPAELSLGAVNKIRTGSPNLSYFRNEILKLKKTAPLVSFIIPMLTVFGALTDEQTCSLGIYLGYFEDKQENRDGISKSYEELAGRGLVGHYKYRFAGEEINAYCLTNYCYVSLAKVTSPKAIGLDAPLGTRKLTGSVKVNMSFLINAVSVNNALIDFLAAARACFDTAAYKKAVESIKYADEHYSVIITDAEETFRCIILHDPSEMERTSNPNVLIGVSKDELKGQISPAVVNIFCYGGGTFARHIYSNGTPDDEAWDDVDAETVVTAEEESTEEESIEEDFPQEEEHTEDDSIVNAITVNACASDEDDKKEENTAEEEETETLDIESIVSRKDAPSDQAFCGLIKDIANRPADTDEDVTSAVVDAVLLANGASMVKDRPMAGRLASQLKLATGLMTDEEPYSAEALTLAYSHNEEDEPALLLASYLYAMLYPSVAYDYTLHNQSQVLFTDYDRHFNGVMAFKPLYASLLTVYDIKSTGFSPAIMSVIGSSMERDAIIKNFVAEAKKMLIVPNAKTRMEYLPKLYKALFGEGSDLHNCMTIIAEGRDDDDSFNYMECVLSEYCTRQGDSYVLNSHKSTSCVEAKLNLEWRKIANFRLEYSGHDQVVRQFRNRLLLMNMWRDSLKEIRKNEVSASKLRTLKNEILTKCAAIESDHTWQAVPYANVLRWLILHVRSYLNGTFENLRVYKSLLTTGMISLDDAGLPVIYPGTEWIRYYEPWRVAVRHITAKRRSLDTITAEILGDDSDIVDLADDNGLMDNLQQLKLIGRLLNSKNDDYVITDAQTREAEALAEERLVGFREFLELAYTYGKVSEIEKETIYGAASKYKSDFYETGDFANWRNFLCALEMQVQVFADDRSAALITRLKKALLATPGSEILAEAGRLISEDANLAVAEEYLNRYDSGETDIDGGTATSMRDHDYYGDYLRVENAMQQDCRRNESRAFSSFSWSCVERRLPEDWTNRLREDSRTFLASWPAGRSASKSEERMHTMFTCLGFSVRQVVKVNIADKEVYQVYTSPTPRSMPDYRHPIAAFGTQLKSPINVVVLYGNHTERQLVDTVSSLGFRAGIPVVLIDRPLDAARKRLIGEIYHTQTSGQTPFLLVDQILCMYLATIQVTERLSALLQCTLPYTNYQPFVREGGATADEMFFGRTSELVTLIDPNGACIVYGGRQLGKTALLERVESRCSLPENRMFAVYSSIFSERDEKSVVEHLVSDINNKTDGMIQLSGCTNLRDMCGQLSRMFRKGSISSMYLLIDEVDGFLEAIAQDGYKQIQPLVELKRETKNSFKFVIAGLHNVCRAKNAMRNNGLLGQLGTPLCIKPLSPTDAMRLLIRPLSYLGFRADEGLHMETILANTNYYPGILQFCGYQIVDTINAKYSKYYRAADGNPPFILRDDLLGSVLNSADLNRSIKHKFLMSLELDPRYYMLARCIALLYHIGDGTAGAGTGYSTNEIIELSKMYDINCLRDETVEGYTALLDEMEEMGILSQPEPGMYRLRRSTFVDIIGANMDTLEQEILSNNGEVL